MDGVIWCVVSGTVLVESSVAARVVDDMMWCGFRSRDRVECGDSEVMLSVMIGWQDFVCIPFDRLYWVDG